MTITAAPNHEFLSTKTYTHNIGLSCAFRQWRAESHCRFLHGYALQIRMEFAAVELNKENWVVDFGSLKSLKGMLEDTFDHKTLVAEDDPARRKFEEMHNAGIIDMVDVEHCGMEATAKLIFECIVTWLVDNGYGERVELRRVEVSEHEANSAIYQKVY